MFLKDKRLFNAMLVIDLLIFALLDQALIQKNSTSNVFSIHPEKQTKCNYFSRKYLSFLAHKP
jgi:hypothetical protein